MLVTSCHSTMKWSQYVYFVYILTQVPCTFHNTNTVQSRFSAWTSFASNIGSSISHSYKQELRIFTKINIISGVFSSFPPLLPYLQMFGNIRQILPRRQHSLLQHNLDTLMAWLTSNSLYSHYLNKIINNRQPNYRYLIR